MSEVALETFSWKNRREYSRQLSELATDPENRAHLDTHVPGLTERYASRRSASKSIRRILRHEGRIADVIKVDEKVVGVASYLLDKTVVHPDFPQQPISGTHTWFWLDRATHEADADTQKEVARHVSSSAARHNKYAQLRTEIAMSETDRRTVNSSHLNYRAFTTLTGEDDPAWALTRTGFRQLGAPAVLETQPPEDPDGLVIPGTEMVLAVLDSETE